MSPDQITVSRTNPDKNQNQVGEEKRYVDHAVSGAEESNPSSNALSARVVALCLLLAATFGFVVPIIDFKFYNTSLGGTNLPIGAVIVLLAVCVLNRALVRFRSRPLLSRNESLVVYLASVFACLVPGRGAENFFIPNVIASFYLATRENQWLDFCQPYLKPWMTPALTSSGAYNSGTVEGWYVGGGTGVPWAAWVVPITAWAILVLALYSMLACLALLLRKQWGEHEALNFPLLSLPLGLAEDLTAGRGGAGGLLLNRSMWLGFGLAALVRSVNSLQSFYSDQPLIPLQLKTAQMLSENPWAQIAPIMVVLFPMVFGISCLLTTEVSLSLWVFFLFSKLQVLLAYYLGFGGAALPTPVWTRGYAKEFVAYEQVGAVFVYCALILLTGRHHYLNVLRSAFGLPSRGTVARGEKVAVWGFLISFMVLITWTIAAGVRWELAVLLWLVYVVLSVVLSRVVAEGGLLYVQAGWAPLGPMGGLLTSWASLWTKQSLVPAAFIQGALMTDMRAFLLPAFLHSFKLAHDRKLPLQKLSMLIGAVILISTSIGWWQILNLGYTDVGGLQLQPWWSRGNGATQPMQNVVEISRSLESSSSSRWMWTGVGGLATYGIYIARTYLAWFPLHPIGLVMSWTPAMNMMWFSIFMAWLVKKLILKFGGTDTYRLMVPFFLGLVLGDIAAIAIWSIVDVWQLRTGRELLL